MIIIVFFTKFFVMKNTPRSLTRNLSSRDGATAHRGIRASMADLPVPGAPGQFSFVRKEDRETGDGGNMAGAFARKALRDEFSKSDGTLMSDFESVLSGECIYLPEFHCAANDFALLAGLARDMEAHGAEGGEGMINWSKHLKHENPEFSGTFKKIVHELGAYFDVEIYATRLNFYRDGTDWKPFHHDSHAYGGREQREDFTVGASFGAERELAFLHEPSGSQFSFPQRNGDVFAFTTEVNKRFKHGVPKSTRGGLSNGAAPRFSIIAWGRRRSLNPRNGGTVACGGERESVASARARLLSDGGAGDGGYVSPFGEGRNGAAKAAGSRGETDANDELVMGSGEVSSLIEAFLRERAAEAERAPRERATGRGSKLAGGLGGAERDARNKRDDNAAAAAMAVPPGTPLLETRGSAPMTAATRAALGEPAFLKLRHAARAFQRGELDAEAAVAAARDAAGNAGANALTALAVHLPDAAKRDVLLVAVEAARLERLETS